LGKFAAEEGRIGRRTAMKTMVSLFALVALAFSIVLAGDAEAAQPPRVQAYQCGPLAASIGPAKVWQTTFYGSKKGLFDDVSYYSASPCFPTEYECKAWLYWAQSDWNYHSNFRPCRPGLGY
jgi:hypothetical protein